MARSKLCLGAAFASAAILSASCCRAETYRNSEFGFSVDVPAGTLTCHSEPPAHDHGVMMSLDADRTSCEAPELGPYLSVTADYNVLDRSSPQAALEDILAERKDVAVGSPPRDLAIPGRLSAAARSESADGWTMIWVVSQGGARPDKGGQGPRVNYFVVLHTRSQRLDRDASLLRRVLDSIEIFPPD